MAALPLTAAVHGQVSNRLECAMSGHSPFLSINQLLAHYDVSIGNRSQHIAWLTAGRAARCGTGVWLPPVSSLNAGVLSGLTRRMTNAVPLLCRSKRAPDANSSPDCISSSSSERSIKVASGAHLLFSIACKIGSSIQPPCLPSPCPGVRAAMRCIGAEQREKPWLRRSYRTAHQAQ